MSQSQFKIRRVEAKDDRSVNDLVQKAFAVHRSIYRPKPEAEAYHNKRMSIGTRLIAELDGKIVGTVRFEEHKEHLHLMGLAVHPKYQWQGIGKSLIQQTIALAPALGYEVIRIDTIKETGNVTFFEKLGFVTVREQTAAWCTSDRYRVVHEVIMDKSI